MAESSFEDESLEEDDNWAMRQRCACRGAESSKDAGSLKLGIIMTMFASRPTLVRHASPMPL